MREILSAKIHRAIITEANVDYEGSITISSEFLEKTGICEYEKVLVADVNNGARFETYVIATDTPKTFCINGAAALLVNEGDKIIIMAYKFMGEESISLHKPKIIIIDDDNNIINNV